VPLHTSTRPALARHRLVPAPATIAASSTDDTLQSLAVVDR
jgi:hypothetical protein